ncbi:MAG TPA: hypothetical protein VM223_08695, partial [Planctomycetota bacterium]|nr:hypothetical protein [Planctomycetota bacterium]
TNGRPPTSHDKAFLTPRELSERFGVPYQALRKRLERFRKSNFNGWNQVSDPLPREARYLFQVAAVKPILDELKASSEMSSERPAK